MYAHLSVLGAYLAWTVLFVFLGGAVLGCLVVGRWRLPKFYLLFGAAFFAYAAGWVCAYFFFTRTYGELVGSLLGSVLMATVFALGLGAARATIELAAVLFVANSVGYFLGSALNDHVGGTQGMLLWGLCYGFFLGAGIGAALHLAQTKLPSNK
jgi:hypothetical protein